MSSHSQEHFRRDDFLRGGLLKTWSSTQASVAQSSGEAEYYALVRACSEALGMQSVMRDLGWDAKIVVRIDSSAAKSVASRTGLGKLRHMEVKFLWAQEAARLKRFNVEKVRGPDTPADLLTKPKSIEDMKSMLRDGCVKWDSRVRRGNGLFRRRCRAVAPTGDGNYFMEVGKEERGGQSSGEVGRRGEHRRQLGRRIGEAVGRRDLEVGGWAVKTGVSFLPLTA